MNDNNITLEERMANHITTCLLCGFVRKIMAKLKKIKNIYSEFPSYN